MSRHLKVLSDAGLSDRFREQHWVYYRAPASDVARSMVQETPALVTMLTMYCFGIEGA